MGPNPQHKARQILWIVFVLNLAVAAAKFLYGLFSGASSMQADGIHSLFDSVGNIIGLIGITLALRPADKEHPYGHSKFETYGSMIIGVLLLIAAFEVGGAAIERLATNEYTAVVSFGSFAVMIGTLIVNVIVTIFEHSAGARLNSEILKADASHTLSDVLVSVGVIIGLGFVAAGFPAADPIAALVVTICIVFSAISVFRRAFQTLSDTSRIPTYEIVEEAKKLNGIRAVHRVRTRGTESVVYCDLHILVDPNMTVKAAHDLGDILESNLKARFPQIIEVLVHIEPYNDEELAEADIIEPAAPSVPTTKSKDQ